VQNEMFIKASSGYTIWRKHTKQQYRSVDLPYYIRYRYVCPQAHLLISITK